jgi:hypothetical protein
MKSSSDGVSLTRPRISGTNLREDKNQNRFRHIHLTDDKRIQSKSFDKGATEISGQRGEEQIVIETKKWHVMVFVI